MVAEGAFAEKRGANEPCWCGSGTKYKKCHRDADAESARAGTARGRMPLRPGVVSPRRTVPPGIARPEYAETGVPLPMTLPEVKDADRIARIRRASVAAAHVLRHTGSFVRPGITTDELDAIAHAETIRLGGFPSPLGYRGFPKSICTSVNEVICHGIPDSRALEDGDIVNIDVTVFLDGMHGDTNATFLVGDVDEASRRLVDETRVCMMKGIEAIKPGGAVRDIGRAIEAHARACGYSVVRAYCGHGIGERFHTRLQIPHHYDARAMTEIVPGMTFTVEPMISAGSWRDRLWPDGWTAVTADGARTAQFEHTLLVTETGVEILTLAPE